MHHSSTKNLGLIPPCLLAMIFGIWYNPIVENNFCITPTKPVIDTIVYEFYASLKDKENCKQWGEMITHVIVQGKEVSIALHEICRYYNVSYYAYDHFET
ncbi:hypothetical protein PVK06_001703 [Gossypium arboreum]|uniref:Uncharacterized protein n=1 Tax=Gossypium arboreum TaxID=29729 RepID=A0ABR0R316_GOSAR|nr:hypothetical protein PVK06_001703 [Gossypium arboreum]